MSIAEIFPGTKDHGMKPLGYETNPFDHESQIAIPDSRKHVRVRNPYFSTVGAEFISVRAMKADYSTTLGARQWVLDPADCSLHEKPSGKVGHVWKWTRKAKEGTKTPTCDSPVEYLCNFCGSGFLGNCNSHDAEECAPCEMRYRKNVRLLVRQPILFARPGSVLFMTLTAPGAEWHCIKHRYKDKKSGEMLPNYRCSPIYDPFSDEVYDCEACPCAENALHCKELIGEFNSSITRKFNDFVTNVRRKFPEFEDFQYAKSIEPQERGALHIHFIVRMKRAARITSELKKALTELVVHLGFGHQFDIQQPADDDKDLLIKFARYIAKYVSKTLSTSGVPYEDVFTKEDFDDLAAQWDYRNAQLGRFIKTGEVPEKGFHWPRKRRLKRPRTWSASRRWGLSMVRIKAQQLAYGSGDKARAASLMNEYMDTVREHQGNMGFNPPLYIPEP
jgi:hypothetical protein